MKLIFKLPILLLAFSPLCSCEAKDTFHFNDLYAWVNNLSIDNVNEVILEAGYIGTAPENTLISINSYKEKEDINKSLNFLKEATLTIGNYEIVGGRYQKISYVTSENIYSVRINNGYVYENSTYYLVTSDFLNNN